MNAKKIALSFIIMALSLALIQFSLLPSVAANTTPINEGTIIAGYTIPTQGQESGYIGEFNITFYEIEGTSTQGYFNAVLKYTFFGGPQQTLLTNDLIIQGNYKNTQNGLSLQFTDNEDDLTVRGQMKNDARYPFALIGFINSPGNGYLTQVFVAGCDTTDSACTELYT